MYPGSLFLAEAAERVSQSFPKHIHSANVKYSSPGTIIKHGTIMKHTQICIRHWDNGRMQLHKCILIILYYTILYFKILQYTNNTIIYYNML